MTTSRLQEELQQSRPFERPEIEAYLNLVRAYDRLHGDMSRFLKRHGISQPQYNVLRILRGAGRDGLPCLAVGDRMVTRVPDVTRLLERMSAAGLVQRARSETDGRVVLTRITAKGQKLLARLDEPVRRFHHEQLGHLSGEDLADLIRLLEQARSRPEPAQADGAPAP